MDGSAGIAPPEAAAEIAPPKVKKPFKLWTITDIVGLDRHGWKVVQDSAAWVGGVASFANLTLVVVFACTIASQSAFGLMEEAPDFWKWTVWFILMAAATVIAAVLQLATDFGLPWASGLAFEKYKISPTALIAMWLLFFMPTTLIMKFDLYSSWAHEREAVIVQAQTEQANDTRILAKFPSAAPPSIDASQKIIAASAGLLRDMRAERDRLIAARDQEKKFLGSTETGMGPAWNKLNDQVLDYDARITAQVSAEAAAETNKQDRIDYDAAKARQEGNAKVTANDGAALTLFYDQPLVIFLRVVGGATVSLLAIIVYFAAAKKREQLAEIAAAKAEAAERARKGWETRRNKPQDADWSESAPLDSRSLTHDPGVETAAIAPADTPTRRPGASPNHPDKSGDDFGARNTGYEEGAPDGTAKPDQPEG